MAEACRILKSRKLNFECRVVGPLGVDIKNNLFEGPNYLGQIPRSIVKEEFITGVRFAEWLGLKNEGLMTKYGPDQTNYYRMAKIYEFSR